MDVYSKRDQIVSLIKIALRLFHAQSKDTDRFVVFLAGSKHGFESSPNFGILQFSKLSVASRQIIRTNDDGINAWNRENAIYIYSRHRRVPPAQIRAFPHWHAPHSPRIPYQTRALSQFQHFCFLPADIWPPKQPFALLVHF